MIKCTDIRQQVADRLSSINDLVWLQEFALHELESKGKRLSLKAAGLLTTDVFGGNPFAGRINIRLNELEGFRTRLTATLLKSAFVQSYELISEYLSEAEKYLRIYGRKSWRSVGIRKAPEHRFEDSWLATGLPAIDPELWKTFSYLRLRRNHYAHIAQTVDPGFALFVATNGGQLNSFWRAGSARRGAAAADFATIAIFHPDVRETISVLRVFLLWILLMDQSISAQIDPAKMSEKLAKEIWREAGAKNFKRNVDTVEKLSRHILKRVRQKTGFSPSLADIGLMVWRFR